jgi:hypothetical protein
MPTEPLVRVRCPTPEDGARCRALLSAAGLSPEESLTWLVVRDASPDAVNDVLVAGGALGRAVAREQVGKLIGYLIDRQGDLAGRGPNLAQIVRRALAETGLADRYAPRDEAALLAAAGALHEHLLATAGGFVSWERFVADFCLLRK